ncbi:MAG: glutamyl-tRNA and/or aspartyl-tRNA amidotransferase, C subunit [Candidatus Nanosalina sp. J07AB43]|nr:MAG: glutamyl-tRNA and/or aspartyl-tRNA amidotransferase, C subunit [Candidatus Nanosalina sp. J07AB43]
MVSLEEVKEVAENARIDIDDSTAEEFVEEFEDILSIFDKLDSINTEDAKPAFHPIDVSPKLREDKREDTLSSEETFYNTDNSEDGFFKGPSA